MDRREFIKSSIGCMCLALLPPLPSAPQPTKLQFDAPVGELSYFTRDQTDQILEDVFFNNNIYVKALKKAGGMEQVWLGEHI